jgi:integrase/recombinase XerD
MLVQLRPKAHESYRSLPVIGPIVDEFTDWVRDCGYSVSAFSQLLGHVRGLAHFFRRRGLRHWEELTQEHFQTAWDRLRKRSTTWGGTIRQVQHFMEQVHRLPPGKRPGSRSELLIADYEQYLRQERCFADHSIACHRSYIRFFLKFLDYDRSPDALGKITLDEVEAFVRAQSKNCGRRTLQQVVGCIRAFLRYQYTLGVITPRLDEAIEAPRVYRQEQLPKALPWPQIRALLRSIDRGSFRGLRDYTMLYLMAAYGLRCGEVVALTLDDVEWRTGKLHVLQGKTKNKLVLPLTDEAGDVIHRYLRNFPRREGRRELFLRLVAPYRPLDSTSVHDILNHWIERSGLGIGTLGTHVFRHSLACRLLHQGVSLKTIGDTLGHRDVESTGAYLRLAIEDLRQVGLPVPKAVRFKAAIKSHWKERLPRVRHPVALFHRTPARFRSGLRTAIQQYLATKKALGRAYETETRTLLHWDGFLYRHQGHSSAILPDSFNVWAARLTHLNPSVLRHRLRIVRNFLRFHNREHEVGFLPDLASFPRSVPPRLPRLVSEEEMARILAAAAKLEPPPTNPLRTQTVRIALLLLFCCGLRRGELTRLKLSDFDPKQNLVQITSTKFHKSRLVPLSSSVAAEVREYLEVRRRHREASQPDCFLFWTGRRWEAKKGYTATSLVDNWQQLCLSVGVLDERGRPPRLHDLRHGFMIRALARWYKRGEHPQSKLAHLATYVGHVNPISTHYYLQLTPPLSQAASQRFHRCCAVVFKGGQP